MDLTTSTVASLKGACKSFLQDLQALPEEAVAKAFGPKTRTVADIVYEVNLTNDHIGMVLRGEQPFDWPEGDWIYAPADFQTKEAVISGFEKSTARIIETVESYTEEDMKSTVQTEHGERTKFERIRFMTWHLTFHDGQLNFIQTLLGDNGWHWS